MSFTGWNRKKLGKWNQIERVRKKIKTAKVFEQFELIIKISETLMCC